MSEGKVDVRKLLYTAAFRTQDMDALLDPDQSSYIRFDPDMGYVPNDVLLKDGVDHSWSTYTYEPGGQRKMVNYPDRPCRINTYGDSFTQCQQVSDDETWQERLAAHFGEPIRNFGCGGYSVYAACTRARLIEATDMAAEYVILNMWDDDHLRSLDACRWIRTAWVQKDMPRERTWPLHGLPWPHVRYDVDKSEFVELPGLCRTADELAALADKEAFHQAFKDDDMAHIYLLRIGGEAPIDRLQATAEALGIDVDLRDARRRQADALKLHTAYGFKATEFILSKLRAWIEQEGKKLLILLSYEQGRIREFIEDGYRFDQPVVDYLDREGFRCVDCMRKAAEDFADCSVSCREYLSRFYIQPAGAAVFGHYNPTGNHWFAFAVKNEIVDWLDPKPPAYRDQ